MTRSIPTADEIDAMVDEGKDMTPYVDMSSLTQPGRPASRRVTIDLPEPQIARADRVAARIGVSRRAAICFALDEWLDKEEDRAAKRDSAAV